MEAVETAAQAWLKALPCVTVEADVKQNLDTLKNEIEAWLKKSGFIVFYGMSRGLDKLPEVEWDTQNYPDYKKFLSVASDLQARLIVLHHRQFNAAVVERALDELEESGLEFDEQRHLESRLREMKMYDGFTCAIEISFDHDGRLYMFELHTEWYDEINALLDELDMAGDADDLEDDESFGGYYSKN